jgi:hypothetical protein
MFAASVVRQLNAGEGVSSSVRTLIRCHTRLRFQDDLVVCNTAYDAAEMGDIVFEELI